MRPDRPVCGVLIVDKPAGMTSHDVVAIVRRLYGTRKVGHTGTLDPMATGVVPVLIGKAAKAAEYLLCEDKRYLATVRFGIETDTEDVTGTVLRTCDALPSDDDVRRACEGLTGEIMQVPPMYSAIKIGGKKLVDLARAGVEIEREARPITVSKIDCAPVGNGEYSLDVSCSKGTYIRTLCADLGKALGCGGAMSALRRLRSGHFTLEHAVTLDALNAMTEEERDALLAPIDSLFAELPAVCPPPFFARLAKNGCELYQKKIGTDYPEGTVVRLYDDGIFFALGEAAAYPSGSAIRIRKMF